MQPTPEYRKYVRSSVERRARSNQFDDKDAEGTKKYRELIPEVLWWHRLGRICVTQRRDQSRSVMDTAIRTYFVRDCGEWSRWAERTITRRILIRGVNYSGIRTGRSPPPRPQAEIKITPKTWGLFDRASPSWNNVKRQLDATHGTDRTIPTTYAAALKTTIHSQTRCRKPYAATQHLMLLTMGVCGRNTWS